MQLVKTSFDYITYTNLRNNNTACSVFSRQHSVVQEFAKITTTAVTQYNYFIRQKSPSNSKNDLMIENYDAIILV